MDFVFPNSMELREIAQDKLPRLIADRPIFDLFPVVDVDDHLLAWEQMDNFVGLQQVRGLDGQPNRVSKVGGKRYIAEPGVYGEFLPIDEQELTRRRRFGTFGDPIDISDLVMLTQDQLLQRRLDRIELIGWTLALTGTFSVSNAAGGVTHTDSYSPQTFTAGTAWSDHANSTPLADLRAIKILHRGHSVSFDRTSTLWLNQTWVNHMLQNTNDADLYGRRVTGLATANNLASVNMILSNDDLPQIGIYDETYFTDAGTATLFIPNAQGVLVGRRPAGQAVGEYRLTRNANNPNLAPGSYMKVIDRGINQVPRSIEVHDGHNGGPVMFYPSAFVSCSL